MHLKNYSNSAFLYWQIFCCSKRKTVSIRTNSYVHSYLFCKVQNSIILILKFGKLGWIKYVDKDVFIALTCFVFHLEHNVNINGPLLFNIYLNDLFYFTEFTEVCSFADDTTFFACDKDLNSLIKHDSLLAIEWFRNNNIKLNQGKCHLLVSGYKHENVWAQIGDEIIWESNKSF